MKMYTTTLQIKLKAYLKEKPQEVFFGAGVFLTVLMGASVHHVASSVFLFFVIAGFSVLKNWTNIWRSLDNKEKWFLAGFMLYALSGFIGYINVQDVHEYIKILERYFRFLLAVPTYLFLRHYKINAIRYLYAAAIFSGPFLLAVALKSYFNNPDVPAQGYYHHITFGSLTVINVGAMLTLLITKNIKPVFKILLIVSIVCGTAAVILSQSRGVWLVLPVYFCVIAFYSIKVFKPKILLGTLFGVVIVSSFLWLLQGEMIGKRIDLAVNEVSSYYNDGQYESSLGTRLAMWDIAMDVWKRHPVVGTGPGDFDDVIYALQEQGKYAGMEAFTSTHNIFIQSIVNVGTVGLLALMFGLFYAPYKAFSSDKHESTKSLLGLMSLFAFAIIGIGESWTLRLPMVSVYITYVLVIVSNVFVEEDRNS